MREVETGGSIQDVLEAGCARLVGGPLDVGREALDLVDEPFVLVLERGRRSRSSRSSPASLMVADASSIRSRSSSRDCALLSRPRLKSIRSRVLTIAAWYSAASSLAAVASEREPYEGYRDHGRDHGRSYEEPCSPRPHAAARIARALLRLGCRGRCVQACDRSVPGRRTARGVCPSLEETHV